MFGNHQTNKRPPREGNKPIEDKYGQPGRGVNIPPSDTQPITQQRYGAQYPPPFPSVFYPSVNGEPLIHQGADQACSLPHPTSVKNTLKAIKKIGNRLIERRRKIHKVFFKIFILFLSTFCSNTLHTKDCQMPIVSYIHVRTQYSVDPGYRFFLISKIKDPFFGKKAKTYRNASW